MNIFDMY